jgi:PAS domain S-box-containing protein
VVPIRRGLEKNEDWYRDLIEHSQVLLCVHDLEGRILSVNPVPARLLGYSVDEMLRMRLQDIVDPQFRGKCDAYLREIARAGESRGLMSVMTRAGERRFWEYHNTLRTEGVTAPVVRGIAHDVTERVLAEDALRASNEKLLSAAREQERTVRELTLFRTLLDQSNDAIEVIDPVTRRFLDVNEKACLELGYSREELLSMTIFDIDLDFDESFSGLVEQRLRESGFATMERVLRRKDGTTFPVEVSLRRVQLDREYRVAVVRDITERKRAEEARRQSETELKEAQRVAHLGSWTLDLKTGKVIWSDELCSILGLDSSSVVLPFSEHAQLYTPKSWALLTAEVDKTIRTGVPYDLELETVRIDGSHGWVDVRGEPVRGVDGAITGLRGVALDISERKRADEALRQREENQRLVLDHLPVGVILASVDEQKVVYHNPKFLELFGYSFEQFTNGSEWWPLAYPDPEYREWVATEWNRRVSEAASTQGKIEPMEVTIACHDGTKKFVRVTGKVIGGLNFVTFTDLTEHKRAEETVRESEARERARAKELETMLEVVPVPVMIAHDSACRRITGNMAAYVQRWVEAGKNLSQSAPPDERPAYRMMEDGVEIPADLLPMQQAAATGKPVYGRALTMVFKDGSERNTVVNAVPLLDEKGMVRGVVGSSIDLTELKQAEKSLRESERRFRAVYEKSPVGIALVDTQTRRFLQANPKFCEITGRSEEELLQLDMASITHPDDIEISKEYTRSVIQGKSPNYGLEKRYLRPDGSVRWGRVLVVPLWGEEDKRQIRITILRDITEQKQAEEALRESEVRYRSIVSAMAEGVLLRDEDGRILACNRSFEEILGVTSEQMVGTTAADWEHRTIREDGSPFPGKDHPAIMALRTGRPQSNIRMGFRRPDEGLTWISINAQPIFRSGESKPHAVVTSFTDITEQKQEEEAIATLVQVRADSSKNFFTSMAVQLAKCLETDCTLIGELIEGQENKVQSIGVCIHGAIVDNFTYDLACAQCARITGQGECPHDCAVKEIFPRDRLLKKMKVEGCIGAPLRNSQGRAIGIMLAAHTRPLTNLRFAESILQLFSTRTAAEIERKRAEEALRQSEERFRVALKNSPTTVFNQDRDLRYTWMYNPQSLGRVSDPLGRTQGEFYGPEDEERIAEIRRRVLETGVGTRHETQIVVNGRKRYFDATVEPIFDPSGAVIGLTGASTDVTALREATEALRDAKKKLTEEKLYLEKEIDTELGFGEIIGHSKALQDVMEQVGKVAASDATVLLLGETGTGKELVSRAIHRLSQRSNNSFIKMNCAAIPTGLLESELFGNEKGAFTGAVSKKIGRIELADKGTLFLDEIGEISLALQPKLLRVLQDQEFERLGGTHTLKVDFRLIAATNRDIADRVREKEFRSDLYYRINVFPIRVPPLRERREDIQLLVEHFVKKFSRRMNRSITSIPKKTMDALIGWEWPGNVRELENFIERSVILTQGSVLVSPLSELKPVSAIAEEKKVDETLETMEREHILRALRESHGQIGGLRGAAMRLGLKRTTLQSKLKHFGINPQSGPPGDRSSHAG